MIKKSWYLILVGVFVSSQVLANSLADTISDEVVDSLIEKHTKLIHSNILSKICNNETRIEFDYGDEKVNQMLLKEIEEVAKQRKQKVENIVKVKQRAELLFQSFLDGTQYGAFVARQHQLKSEEKSCSPEVIKTIAVSQREFLDAGGFVLKKR